MELFEEFFPILLVVGCVMIAFLAILLLSGGSRRAGGVIVNKPRICAACAAEMPAGANFCKRCGRKLQA